MRKAEIETSFQELPLHSEFVFFKNQTEKFVKLNGNKYCSAGTDGSVLTTLDETEKVILKSRA